VSLFEKIRTGDRRGLSQAITLIESSRSEHRKEAEELLNKVHINGHSTKRIAISGVPGVGKSTFIETLGEMFIHKGHKVAVLAIDPTSPKSGGSILGDKTRMEKLSQNPNAYIRPSPTKTTLGGVASKTRESIFLCEEAGYDIILIETVGVGQSEHLVSSMVDMFVVLMLPGAGDELQGIKRGILELADTAIVNKADGDNVIPAKIASKQYESAFHIIGRDSFWQQNVMTCSALKNLGMNEVIENIEEFFNQSKSCEHFKNTRSEQLLIWFELDFKQKIENFLREDKKISQSLAKTKNLIINGKKNVLQASSELIKKITVAD